MRGCGSGGARAGEGRRGEGGEREGRATACTERTHPRAPLGPPSPRSLPPTHTHAALAARHA